ncbi:unnamed protein product [Haemonchus placei]|uniref:Transposase n=1 Tax=Haemonchus placei TaxID=6290 RepID=A0A0N4WUX9_HAEPC|nr:unnamed protein product [Haemonchus placei]
MVFGERPNGEQHLHSTVHTIELENESEPWETHWKVQTQAIEQEYSGPKDEESAHINEQVLKKFTSAIEKCDIGYVVRLPFKETHEYLADNRAPVLRRLRSVLRK